ncbi:hypothetical protein NLU13_6499 [Sarocladium strictum]|uniref:Uncharacterized protein n=1 Tax=Sarocladium strictum TaxID=5046 RepID=A0AA39GHK5_SARSR|nr:hypothetical protein NLU13_6499 [Sarocladium strictum]
MPVQQHVLNWLYSVLTSEYHDVNRTYNDVAQALARYPSLSPRTDVHTFPNGSSALLVHLTGTLPVNFRGSTYRFPMSIWVPHAYPREAPLVYVTPTATMMIRPGQHVDPQGQVYHPYLVGWIEFWDKSTIHDFLAILSDIFAKEPPVIARQAQSAPPQPIPPSPPYPAHVQSPPPRPPLPPEIASRGDSRSGQRPPPPPPKPHEESRQAPISRHDTGPPLPPLPHQASSPVHQRPSRYESAPALPHQAQGVHSPPAHAHYHPPAQQWPSQHGPTPGLAMIATPAGPYTPQGQPHAQPQSQTGWSQGVPSPAWNQGPAPPQSQPGPPPPPPDLLDEPLTLSIPSQTNVTAPPIPPNPEKDALLAQLAHVLYSMRQQVRQQNQSSMDGLAAQRNAMAAVIPTIQSEMGQLNQLSNMLTSNANILHDALRKADGVIEGSKNHPCPDIDELLVAPTVVANQLYNLVAEERALGDAIFMLGRAMERGRISPVVFAKMTRSLAREWYMKKALVLEIGKGMGLAS